MPTLHYSRTAKAAAWPDLRVPGGLQSCLSTGKPRLILTDDMSSVLSAGEFVMGVELGSYETVPGKRYRRLEGPIRTG